MNERDYRKKEDPSKNHLFVTSRKIIYKSYTSFSKKSNFLNPSKFNGDGVG